MKSPDEPKEKKVRMQKSRIKTMLTVFFDSKGIIHKEFIPEGQTVNAQCYLGVLKRLWDRIHRVRPEYKEVGSWFLLHDNAPSHKALIVREFLAKKGIITKPTVRFLPSRRLRPTSSRLFRLTSTRHASTSFMIAYNAVLTQRGIILNKYVKRNALQSVYFFNLE